MFKLNLFRQPKESKESSNDIEIQPTANHGSIGDVIKSIKAGDRSLKDKLIYNYRPFIMGIIKKVTGMRFGIEDSEEYSVGLAAFNEAIDCYDEKRNHKFLVFSEMVITRRLRNYIRNNRKNKIVYPFTFFEQEDDYQFEEKYLKSDSYRQFEEIEIKEDIEYLEYKLGEFGITLEYLAEKSPKHEDSRKMCIEIARMIAKSPELYNKLEKTKSLPQSDLLKMVKVHRRTLENNRKFIIAVCLILKSDMEEMKEFFKIPMEGRERV